MSSIPWSPPRPRPRPPQGLPLSFLFLLSIPRPLPGPLPLPLPLCTTEKHILEEVIKLCASLPMHNITFTNLSFTVNVDKWLQEWFEMKSIHTLLLFHPPHVSSLHLVFSMASLSLTLRSRIFCLLILRHVIFVIILLFIIVILVITVVAVFVKITALERRGLAMASLWISPVLAIQQPQRELLYSNAYMNI